MPCPTCDSWPCALYGPCAEPPLECDLAGLDPDLRERLELWRGGCRHAGLVVEITEAGQRSEARAAYLYGRGRDGVPYGRPGLTLTETPEAPPPGWCFLITHQRNDRGELVALRDLWARRPNAWAAAGALAVALGLRWGGTAPGLDLGRIEE